METENQINENSDQGGSVPQPEPFAPLGAQTTETASAQEQTQKGYDDSGWSWGGFAFNFMFAIATRNYVYLWLLLLMVIPFVNFLVMFGVMIFFGIKGRELARKSTTFSNNDQYLGFMKGLDHVGKIIMYFYVVVFAIGIFASIALVSLSGARDRAQDAYMMNQQRSIEMQQMMDEEKYEYR